MAPNMGPFYDTNPKHAHSTHVFSAKSLKEYLTRVASGLFSAGIYPRLPTSNVRRSDWTPKNIPSKHRTWGAWGILKDEGSWSCPKSVSFQAWFLFHASSKIPTADPFFCLENPRCAFKLLGGSTSTAGCLGQGGWFTWSLDFYCWRWKRYVKKGRFSTPPQKNGWTIQMIQCGRGISGRNE